MTLTIDDVSNLPELEFEDTRKVGKPFEWGQIAPLRRSGELIFEPREIIFGFYHDAKGDVNYMIHSTSLSPLGGFPDATPFSEILKYKSIRPYKHYF